MTAECVLDGVGKLSELPVADLATLGSWESELARGAQEQAPVGNFQVREGAAAGLAGKLGAALRQMVTTELEGHRTRSHLSFQTCRKKHR